MMNQQMNEQWWCLDCRGPVELSVNGRCEVCDSDAVDMRSESDVRMETVQSLPPTISQADGHPLFMKLGAFLRFGNSSPASLLSSLVRPSSCQTPQPETFSGKSTSVN
jgi:hypothetical protein